MSLYKAPTLSAKLDDLQEEFKTLSKIPWTISSGQKGGKGSV